MSNLPTLSVLLETGTHLVIYCCRPECGRQVRMPAAEAVARLGADTTFAEAERRLSCTACGARGSRREIQARPCAIDYGVIQARERAAHELRTQDEVSFDLERYIATMRRLAGGPVAGDEQT